MKKNIINIAYKVFPILLIFYSLFVYLNYVFHIVDYNLNKIDYSLILACTIFTLLYSLRSKNSKLVCISFLFTVIADLILVFYIEYRIFGLIAFIFVQVAHGLRFSLAFKKISLKLDLLIRGIAICIVEIGYVLITKSFDITLFLTFFYFTLLVLNFIYSIFFFEKKNPLWITLVIGFLFFILCDIFVGVGCASDFFDIKELLIYRIYDKAPFGLDWFFYIPAKTLLALSTLIKNNTTKSNLS